MKTGVHCTCHDKHMAKRRVVLGLQLNATKIWRNLLGGAVLAFRMEPGIASHPNCLESGAFTIHIILSYLFGVSVFVLTLWPWGYTFC
ncbi:hypothetical protein V6N11_037449 [Hibiscus sabdariffa]|uniref:Uncharacterized protein n=1 Tax=Hibiscus sabdariffa TaxID=183260 RepID=A0ABR2P1T1_9ROSI